MINPQQNRPKGTPEFRPIVLMKPMSHADELAHWVPALLKIRGLSAASGDMLKAVFKALMIEGNASRGYKFQASVTTRQIADQLGRTKGLVPYDRRILRALSQAELIVESKRSLPARTIEGWDGKPRRMGAGWEYVYSINRYILEGLLKQSNSRAFDELNALMFPGEQLVNVRTKSTLETAMSDAGKQHRGLDERLMSEEDRLRLHKGEDFESHTHTYTWASDRHIKRRKPRTLKDRIIEFLENV